ncbi:MAG: hypothetical protein CML47_04635 [Rhodobacteraceae bacterium]|nr:MAG: hypothetical protein CML47_04635 [Paracoccaceae bacterium]|tara:strand:- start:1776 stop:3098 length:1323 start_codon:yes stop_codon:yes gene_type:complete
MKINLRFWAYRVEDYISDIIITFLSSQDDYFNSLYRHVYRNRFLNKPSMEIVVNNIQKILYRRYLISKLFKQYIYKKRGLVKMNDIDLLMEPLDDNIDYPYIIENNNIYRFGKSDVRNMINTSIHNCRYRHPSILPIKNPYTNSILNKTQLYNLYIKSYENQQMHWILREFAKLDFNTNDFKSIYLSYLQSNALREDIINYSEKEFRRECDLCFRKYVIGPFFFKHFKYIGLDTIDISILRKFFTQFIIFESQSEDIYRSPNQKRGLTKHIKNIIKFWEIHPWIYAACGPDFSTKDKNTNNAKITLYLNSISNPDQMELVSPFAQHAAPDQMESVSPFSVNRFSSALNRLNRIMGISRQPSISYPSLTSRWEDRVSSGMIYDSSNNEERFVFNAGANEIVNDIRFVSEVISDEAELASDSDSESDSDSDYYGDNSVSMVD